MRRYTNWGLIFFVGLVALSCGTSGYWLPEAQPYLTEDVDFNAFSCPGFLDNTQCKELQRINETNPKLAENLRESLDPDNDFEAVGEPSLEELGEGLNENTADEPIPNKVKTGSFQDLDILRKGEGLVNIWEIHTGGVIGRFLRFEDFRVNNGPDLRVYLSVESNPDALEQFIPGEAYDVGNLKGNTGAQNFEIDRDLDLTAYKSVVIYSADYNLIMAVAPIVTN